MEKSKPILTPMGTSCRLDKDEGWKSIEESKYRGKIDSLLYLTAYRSDIMYFVCMSACFYKNHRVTPHCSQTHYDVSHNHTTYRFMVSKGTDDALVGYCNSDFSRCKLDRKILVVSFILLGILLSLDLQIIVNWTVT